LKERLGQRTPTEKLINRLRAIADAGGMLTRDRLRILIESADRLEELDERVAIMSETHDEGFNTFNEIVRPGGDRHEEH